MASLDTSHPFLLMRSHCADSDLGLVAAFLGVEQLVDGERIVVVADLDVLDGKLVHDECQLLLALGLFLLFHALLASLVGLEGIDDELVVGDGIDGVVV